MKRLIYLIVMVMSTISSNAQMRYGSCKIYEGKTSDDAHPVYRLDTTAKFIYKTQPSNLIIGDYNNNDTLQVNADTVYTRKINIETKVDSDTGYKTLWSRELEDGVIKSMIQEYVPSDVIKLKRGINPYCKERGHIWVEAYRERDGFFSTEIIDEDSVSYEIITDHSKVIYWCKRCRGEKIKALPPESKKVIWRKE